MANAATFVFREATRCIPPQFKTQEPMMFAVLTTSKQSRLYKLHDCNLLKKTIDLLLILSETIVSTVDFVESVQSGPLHGSSHVRSLVRAFKTSCHSEITLMDYFVITLRVPS